MSYPIEVDETRHLQAYPDVGKALQKRAFGSGQAHFREFGFREGRYHYTGFALRSDSASLVQAAA
jgi:hypothetical protein